jgi:hypothetical protein
MEAVTENERGARQREVNDRPLRLFAAQPPPAHHCRFLWTHSSRLRISKTLTMLACSFYASSLRLRMMIAFVCVPLLWLIAQRSLVHLQELSETFVERELLLR